MKARQNSFRLTFFMCKFVFYDYSLTNMHDDRHCLVKKYAHEISNIFSGHLLYQCSFV